jgi:peptidoglycan L-alanyl-D-glutamate endopeptidase CwlK
MTYRLSNRSKQRLVGIRPDLITVVTTAILLTEVDFTILEGLRTEERQRKLVDSGASTTMNSRHLTGHAVDLGAYVDGEVRWDWPLYYKIAYAMKGAAERHNIEIVWGGDWKSFPDGPHFQLDWGAYPS